MPQPEQNLKNHTRFDPMFHGFLFVGALILLGATIYALVRQPDWWGVVRLLGVLWAIVLMVKTRLYALKVQDRVIRLEERLRLLQLLPDSTRARIGELGFDCIAESRADRRVERRVLLEPLRARGARRRPEPEVEDIARKRRHELLL